VVVVGGVRRVVDRDIVFLGGGSSSSSSSSSSNVAIPPLEIGT